MTFDISFAHVLGVFLIVIGVVMWLKGRKQKKLALATLAAAAAAEATARADEAARIEAEHAAAAQAALLAREEAALDAAIAEQEAFESDFNAKSKVRYDSHLRRRAVVFRANQKLGRGLTVGEILKIKERVK